MSQLIQMRQQIRAIESIEKITHAMRLISMSSHSQLNHKTPLIQNYKNELFKILEVVQSKSKEVKSNILNPTNSSNKILIVLIGSQKGLAGIFNSALFKFFEKDLVNYQNFDIDFIIIGKKIYDSFKKQHSSAIKVFNVFNIHNLQKINTEIFDMILNANPAYSKVIFFGNYPKSFFFQIPEKYTLIPLLQPELSDESKNNIDIDNYIWEQPVDEVLDYLIKDYLNFSIQSLLFNSLLAEHAARFQFMNNASKNAEDLLNQLKLQYNKLRQAKITKEITELSASL